MLASRVHLGNSVDALLFQGTVVDAQLKAFTLEGLVYLFGPVLTGLLEPVLGAQPPTLHPVTADEITLFGGDS